MWEKKRDLDRRKIRNVKTGNKGHNKTFKKVRDKKIKVDERISSVLASYLQLQQLVKVSNSLIHLSSPPTAQIQTAGWGQGPGPLRWSALGKGEQSTRARKLHPCTRAQTHATIYIGRNTQGCQYSNYLCSFSAPLTLSKSTHIVFFSMCLETFTQMCYHRNGGEKAAVCGN